MRKRILSIGLLLILILSLGSVSVFAEPGEVSNGETTDVVETKTEEDIEIEKAKENLEAFKSNFNQVENSEVFIPYITVVEVPIPIGEPTVKVDEEGNDVIVNPETRNVIAFGQLDSIVYFDVESIEFQLWVDEMIEDIRKDALEGLSILKETNVTLDHIKLEHWGEFFNKYYGKTLTNFPVGNIVLEYGDYKFIFENSKETKKLFMDFLLPPLVESIEKEAKAYPVKRYALDISSGSLLKDYVCDLTSVREVETVYPFDNVDTHIFFNAGDYYGMALSKDYVDILRGYIEDSGYNRRVEGSVPGCVNVLSYITLIRNISGNTISDKVLSDFTIYENLAVRLDTKELVDTTDMTTTTKELFFSDYKLNADNLILAPIKDSVVIIQPTYLECFFYNNYNKGLNRTIDITNFIQTGEPYFTVTANSSDFKEAYAGTQSVPVSYFCDEDGVLDVQLGRAPFLMYYSSHTPYDLMINWAYNQSNGHFTDEKEKEAFINTIKKDMDELGRKADYDTYVKAAGKMTDTMNLILKVVIIFVILIVVIIIVVIIRKKLKAGDTGNSSSNNGNSNLLFDNDDFDSDDDDDDFGGFELK